MKTGEVTRYYRPTSPSNASLAVEVEMLPESKYERAALNRKAGLDKDTPAQYYGKVYLSADGHLYQDDHLDVVWTDLNGRGHATPVYCTRQWQLAVVKARVYLRYRGVTGNKSGGDYE